MQKKISWLLSLVMILSTCMIEPIYATGSGKIKLRYLSGYQLKETQTGLQPEQISNHAEEAMVEWQIDKGNGTYELAYYTDSINDNGGDTTKVLLKFEIGKNKTGENQEGKARVSAQLLKSNGQPIDFIGYQRLFPYTGMTQTITMAPGSGTSAVTELTLPGYGSVVAESSRELSLKLGKNLNVRIKTDGKVIQVWTDQINQGYVTDFNLFYEGEKQSTAIVFPGITGIEVSSIHLEKGSGLKNRASWIDASGGEQAGSHPGVKVSFKRPFVRKGNKYVIVSGKEAEELKVTLNLQTKLEPDNTVAVNQNQVSFDLAGDKLLTGEYVNGKGKKVSIENREGEQDPSGEMMSLYYVKTKDWPDGSLDDAIKDYVIEWPALEESMVIGGGLTLTGAVKVEGETFPINTGNTALKTGYTYLRYTPEQSNAGEVTLQITPYKYKGEVTYQVYSVNGNSAMDLDSDRCLFGTYKFNYDPMYPERKLEISMPSGSESIYMVKTIFTKEGNEAVSQNVYYNINGSHVIIKPYTPQIKEVNGIYVIPEGEIGAEAAGFNIAWSAPSKEKLLEMLKGDRALYYELSLYDSEKTNKAVIAVFKLEKEETDSKKLKVTQEGRYVGEVYFDEAKQQFIASKVVLKHIEEAYWEKIHLENGYRDGATYPEINEGSYEEGLSYPIPNSFYLGMQTLLETETGLKPSANSSELYPLTLDKTVEVIPAPNLFDVVRQSDSTDLSLNFNNVSVRNYTDYILTPAQWFLVGSNQNLDLPGKYEIFLYQAEYLEGSVTKKNEISDGQLLQAADGSESDQVYVIDDPLTIENHTVDFEGNEAALNALRKGKLVKLTLTHSDLSGNGQMNTIKLNGLDPNQPYYVRIRTVLEFERELKGEVQTGKDQSLFSKVYGFTTSMVSKPIEPDEEIPPAPKDFTAKARDNSSAILNWKDPALSAGTEGMIQYEIIRTTQHKLSEELLKPSIEASEIIASETAKKATLFDHHDYRVIQLDGQQAYEWVDETLQPNTLYYYYIRTVYKGNHSDWIYQPVTTLNIEKPIGLKAFNTTKTSTDISFLAKVRKENLYEDFDFGIAVQGEDSPEWKVYLASNLKDIGIEQVTTQEGYTYYAYRLTGLRPGKRYNIKVCVIDKTKEMIDNAYQHSLYTAPIYIRTEYDEAEQEKEDKYKEFLDRFDQEVDKLRRRPYWIVEEGTHYKYRTEYLSAEMALGQTYSLITDSKANEAVYYLPAEVIAAMDTSDTIFKIHLGEDELALRPGTIKKDDPVLQEAKALISNRRLEDYYVEVSVRKHALSTRINGQLPISSQITVGLSLVYMEQQDLLTEADIKEALEHLITDYRKVFIDKLETKVKKGMLEDSVLQSLIDEVISDITAEHMAATDRIMSREIEKKLAISQISKAILITHTGETSSIEGYHYAFGWNRVPVYSVAGTYILEAKQLGSYIFTGQRSLIEIVPELAPYQDFINQYQLTEFFTMNSFSVRQPVTKGQVYGALAKVMGAQQGTDYSVYLSQQGIKGPSLVGIGNVIRQDEAIYLIMQGYEKLHHRKVQTIAVRNKQGIQNIGAFQPHYRDYVYAAVELKITPIEGARVLPSKQMSAQDIISMLYQMQR